MAQSEDRLMAGDPRTRKEVAEGLMDRLFAAFENLAQAQSGLEEVLVDLADLVVGKHSDLEDFRGVLESRFVQEAQAAEDAAAKEIVEAGPGKWVKTDGLPWKYVPGKIEGTETEES
jgi:hypothetical protein